ncbi:predicted protein [Mycobacterium tuberculosis T46]|nr:predicted protein [Mycobacterium tuberculosis T46]
MTVWQGPDGAMAVPLGWAATVVGEGGFSVTAAPVALAVSAGPVVPVRPAVPAVPGLPE